MMEGIVLSQARDCISITFGRASLFKFVLPALAFIADKANLTLSAKDGLVLRTMSSVDVDAFFFIQSSVRTDFSCKEGVFTFGLDLLTLAKAMEDAVFDRLLTLSVDLRSWKLTTEIKGLTSEECNTSSYELEKKIELAINGVDPYSYEYNLVVGVPSDEFIRIFSQLEIGPREVGVQLSKDMINFCIDQRVIGRRELGSCMIVGYIKDGSVVDLKFPGQSLSSYLLLAKMTDVVWLCYSEDAPPMMNFVIEALGNIHVYNRTVPEKLKEGGIKDFCIEVVDEPTDMENPSILFLVTAYFAPAEEPKKVDSLVLLKSFEQRPFLIVENLLRRVGIPSDSQSTEIVEKMVSGLLGTFFSEENVSFGRMAICLKVFCEGLTPTLEKQIEDDDEGEDYDDDDRAGPLDVEINELGQYDWSRHFNMALRRASDAQAGREEDEIFDWVSEANGESNEGESSPFGFY